jgi:hypothetical protein
MKFATALLLPLFATAAQLPELRTEPIGGGTVFFVKNISSQPLTGYLIELVNYPGSSYTLWQDEPAEPIAAGAEKRIQVTNMTAGAVPDYMKIQAAIYADGSTAGVPEKVAQFLERRKAVLAMTRELVQKLVQEQAKGSAIAYLKQREDSLQPVGKVKTNSQPVINDAASRALVNETAAFLEGHSLAETVSQLRVRETVLAASKPSL